MTRDGRFVVWHGPDLKNVRIAGVDDRPARRERKKIYHYDWSELDGKAWVADPGVKSLEEKRIDLSGVPKEDDRHLLLFEDLLDKFPAALLNFEILDRGVDGIMTDRPKSVRAIMDRWIAAR